MQKEKWNLNLKFGTKAYIRQKYIPSVTVRSASSPRVFELSARPLGIAFSYVFNDSIKILLPFHTWIVTCHSPFWSVNIFCFIIWGIRDVKTHTYNIFLTYFPPYFLFCLATVGFWLCYASRSHWPYTECLILGLIEGMIVLGGLGYGRVCRCLVCVLLLLFFLHFPGRDDDIRIHRSRQAFGAFA